MRTFFVATLTILCLAAGGTIAAADLSDSAVLTPGGLGDLKVGMTEAQVEAVLGHNVHLDNTATGGECATSRLPHRSYGLFTNGILRRVTLGSAFFATKSGLRVGMAESEIRKIYGSKARRSPHAYVQGGSYYKVTRGNRRLVFETDGTKITAISGGRRPEVDYIEGCA
jgi:hypothetical protein